MKNKTKGICEIANDNADGQTIVSGDNLGMKEFQNAIVEKIEEKTEE